MSSIPDPLQLWRKALSSLESSGNTLANQAMNTGDFAAALHQMANLSLGMQQTFEKVLTVYFKQLNLPSRKDIAELAAALQRIEVRLDQLSPRSAAAATQPRPARTRRPEQAAAASKSPALAAPASPVAKHSAATRAPAKRARRRG